MSKADERTRFYFYIDWNNDLMDDFTFEEKGRMLDAICRFFQGEEVEKFEDRGLRKVFSSIKKTMDFNMQQYKKVCEKRRNSINQRYKSKQKDTNEYKRVQMNTKVNDIDIDNDNDIDIDNDNEIENDNDNEIENDSVITQKKYVRTLYFREYIKKYCPNILSSGIKQPNEKQWDELCERYSQNTVEDILLGIDNRRDCLKKYQKSGYLYNALKGW